MKTRAAPDAIVGDMQARHPIRATVEEATHLLEVANEGRSPATPAILVGAVLAFVVPIVAILILLDFTVAHYA